MKKRQEIKQKPITEENWNNPFMDLKIELPKEPEKKPVAPPPPPPPEAKLSKEDQALLRAFESGGDVSVGSGERVGTRPKYRAKVTFNIQRKGKGGKTVTLVHGLERMEMLEQMELCTQVKNGLGCGARFANGVLEIQGDQPDRARDWFAKHNFDC